MKKFLLPLLVVLVLCCSSHTDRSSQQTAAPTHSDSKHAVLALRGDPRQGFAPLRVTFHAELKGILDGDSTYYCSKEEWEFGDGAVSSQTPNCEPMASGTKMETDFIMDHVYDDPGTYTAGFTLGEKKLRSNKVTITVLENLRSPNGQ